MVVAAATAIAATAAAVAVVIVVRRRHRRRRRCIQMYTNSFFSLSSFSVVSDFGWFSVYSFNSHMCVVCVHICVCACMRTPSSEASSKIDFVLKSTLGRSEVRLLPYKARFTTHIYKISRKSAASVFVSLFFRACKDVCVSTTHCTLYIVHACMHVFVCVCM